MTVAKDDIDNLFEERKGTFGGLSQDYFALLYLSDRRFIVKPSTTLLTKSRLETEIMVLMPFILISPDAISISSSSSGQRMPNYLRIPLRGFCHRAWN